MIRRSRRGTGEPFAPVPGRLGWASPGPTCFTVRVRRTEFWRLMEDEFGGPRARMLADHHALTSLGSVSAAVALERGDSPKTVWQAICADLGVPPERRFGRDRPVKRS